MVLETELVLGDRVGLGRPNWSWGPNLRTESRIRALEARKPSAKYIVIVTLTIKNGKWQSTEQKGIQF